MTEADDIKYYYKCHQTLYNCCPTTQGLKFFRAIIMLNGCDALTLSDEAETNVGGWTMFCGRDDEGRLRGEVALVLDHSESVRVGTRSSENQVSETIQ